MLRTEVEAELTSALEGLFLCPVTRSMGQLETDKNVDASRQAAAGENASEKGWAAVFGLFRSFRTSRWLISSQSTLSTSERALDILFVEGSYYAAGSNCRKFTTTEARCTSS